MLREKRLKEIRSNPGRGGCGILGIAELSSGPSHDLIQKAVSGLIAMEHRGGSLEGTGDGAGILFRPERSYFERFLAPGRGLPSSKEPLIVGTIFFLHGERNIHNLKREIDVILLREGLAPMGWRKVSVNKSALGKLAQEDVPEIYQLFVAKGHRRESQLFDLLHRVKVVIEDQIPGIVNVVSLAPYTTVYKALSTAKQLISFYPDLNDPDLVTRVVVGHRRYSTNTFSNWNLVQPFRHIAHNGEINSITANCRAVRDAECAINIGDTLMNHGSDSAQFDRVAEMIAANGVGSIHEAVRRMMMPAWNEMPCTDQERKFFEANSRAMGTLGAWEGPVAIVGSDGLNLFGAVDRMGLRPLRYVKTSSGRIIISSEIGAVEACPDELICDGQLEPGDMIIADLKTGELILPESSTQSIIKRTGFNFESLSTVDLHPLKTCMPREPLPARTLNAFGWTTERIRILKETVNRTKEPIYGMGNDRPLAIFSENHSRLYSFLHQIVAVVTNPPIDPIREGGAIDTTVYLGRSPIISRTSSYKSWPQYKLDHPILTNEMLEALFSSEVSELRAHRLDATFADTGNSREIVRRIHDLTDEALEVIRSHKATILVISDFEATKGSRLPLPMLLVISALHQALAENGLRRDASIVAETGEVHEGHDVAILLAYGATAVNPYAMFNVAKSVSGLLPEQAVQNVVSAIVCTLKRVMSKMGITTFTSYRGSALFEAIGISSDVVEYYIPDTVSRLGGITISDIYDDIVARFSNKDEAVLKNRNVSVYRKEVVDALQLVARHGNAQGDYDRFFKLLEETPPVYLRDMLEWRLNNDAISIDGVASVNEIIRTTVRGAAMSHGALNATAHRAIAAAFNHFDSFSNCGEGGEDIRRNPKGEWEKDRSKSRQIASGRFGVDATYLVNADEIEIKIGQGAKPGEGGHLPGHKVSADIARIRKTQEGIDLISPPPHHDIYSIEDLAQLITNLRQLHPKATISVKVPSITKLGTIAVGIVKAGADVIVISCFTGGTGAASSGSIIHAGLPLERGVSEVHQYLVANGIRAQVCIRADGGIKSGLDAAKIMVLGADEVTIGTPLLVAENCVYCRGCNKGNCPVGIATQDVTKQNERFMRRAVNETNNNTTTGSESYEQAKEGVIRYLECFANHLREILASLGFKHPSELVGRVDLLKQRISGNARWDCLDLTELVLDFYEDSKSAAKKVARPERSVSKKNEKIRLATNSIKLNLKNSDHAIGATLAGEIARNGNRGKVEIIAKGFAGQGFGFCATTGMSLRLAGYANDCVAEAIGGGAKIVIIPPHRLKTHEPSHLIGNAAAYGATGGTLFVAGKAGQRFGVRNSGAILVCEGVGKYAFEYMTGGVGVVLGRCGPCVGSGMTGGELYLYDPQSQLPSCLHPDKEKALKEILIDFVKQTESKTASKILQNWLQERSNFLYICPK
ncbi:MAG: glutamate synthase large subunit [Pseudomonadota bacterium]